MMDDNKIRNAASVYPGAAEDIADKEHVSGKMVDQAVASLNNNPRNDSDTKDSNVVPPENVE